MALPEDDVAKEIVSLLPTIAVALRLSALLEVAAADLTPNQLLCALLVEESIGRRLSAGELARHLSVSPPAATAVVDRLVDAGFFARSQGADRRVVWVSLTTRGRAVVGDLRRGLADKISSVLGSMEAAAQDALVDALRQVAAFAREISSGHGHAGSDLTHLALP